MSKPSDPNREQTRELQLDITPEVAQGRYTNFALISHTANEFIFDFALSSSLQNASIVSRVITNPRHAKELMRALAENIRRYESVYGAIPDGAAQAPAVTTDTTRN
jgi:hypothetical protein